MVTTRGKKPVLPAEALRTRRARPSVPPKSQETATEDPVAQTKNADDETGTRSRKRRRKNSTPAAEESRTPPDQASRQKATSGRNKTTYTSNAGSDAGTQSHTAKPSSQRAAVGANPMMPQGVAPAMGELPIHKKGNFVVSGVNNAGLSTAQGQALLTEAYPDLAAVISNIIDHGETIDSHYATHGLNELGIVDTESFKSLGASMQLKIQSLPILENLAIQILSTLARSSYEEVVTIATDPDSEAGQAYATLKSLFDHTKKVYSIHEPFLVPGDLGLIDPAHISTIRKANLATFVSSVFGSYDVGFYHLNEYFLDTFVGEGNRLLKSQAHLFLDLKTQAFISAQGFGQVERERILEDLFPTDLEERLLERKGGSASLGRQLAPSETDFLQRARNRSKALSEEANSDDSMAFLTQKYVWEDFLRDISEYVSRHFESLVGVPIDKRSQPGRSAFYHPRGNGNSLVNARPDKNANGNICQQSIPQVHSGNIPTHSLDHSTDAQPAVQGFGFHQGMSVPADQDMAQHKSPYHSNGFQRDEPVLQPSNTIQDSSTQYPLPPQYQFEPQSQPHTFFHQSNQLPLEQHNQPHINQTPVDMNIQQRFYGDQPAIPFPTQSAPTQVLYERARMAATAKASPSSRRAGTPSQRRPWSAEEENALMAGLDRVKGPHWSQILAMFGAGGTINEVLKDRNQVQLKDKARNLKLFFLKSGIEVPYYLQFVTGELKTRAPAQALKHEAKEKEKDSEERAHVEGVMTLAGVHDTGAGANESNVAYDDPEGNEHGAREMKLDDIQARMNAFSGQPQVYPPMSEANLAPGYNHEVTPAFQAMIDAAAAEAARVGSSGD